MYIYHHNQSASQSRSVQFHLFVDMIGGPKISKRPLDLDYAQLGAGAASVFVTTRLILHMASVQH